MTSPKQGAPESLPPSAASQLPARVLRVDGDDARTADDVVAVEEPLEIRVLTASGERTVAVTMRTPGDDAELAAGFLFAEGVVSGPEQVRSIVHRADPTADGGDGVGSLLTGRGAGLRIAAGSAPTADPDDPWSNIVVAELAADLDPDLRGLERHFFTTSACGVCGKAGLDNLSLRGCRLLPPGPVVDGAVLAGLPDKLRAAQGVFAATGGLHAAALFDPAGDLLAVREDVGRHNALDKLVGWALLAGRLPLAGEIVLVSGRSSFEILQKCLVAEVAIVCSVSAPSSLAVSLARRFGVTLVGFLRGERFNVYSRPDRIAGAPALAEP